jgi:hypothetical protein
MSTIPFLVVLLVASIAGFEYLLRWGAGQSSRKQRYNAKHSRQQQDTKHGRHEPTHAGTATGPKAETYKEREFRLYQDELRSRTEQAEQDRLRQQQARNEAEELRRRQDEARKRAEDERLRQEREKQEAEESSRRQEEARQRAEQERQRAEQSTEQPVAKDERHYAQVLGLRGRVTAEDVRSHYRKLAAGYHPDKVNHLGEKLKVVAEHEMKEINEAYEFFRKKYGF